MKRILVALPFILGLATCPPKPPKCPEQCPPGLVCTDPKIGCEAPPAPGHVCEVGVEHCDCYHWPEGSTEWQLAVCPEGQTCKNYLCESPPPPACPESCPVGTICTDPNVGCVPIPPIPSCNVPPDEGLVAVEPNPTSQKHSAVVLATAAVGNRCGKPVGESASLVVQKLIEQGSCARVWGGDTIAVQRDDHPNWYEEFDVVRSDGCLIELYKYTWTLELSSCPNPLPNRSSDALKLNCNVHNVNTIDCTVTTVMQCNYCRDIGMGEFNGQPRCGCPMRSECPGFQCEFRFACEMYASYGGTRVESRNGATCEPYDNPFQFKPNGGNCRLCTLGGVCGEWF